MACNFNQTWSKLQTDFSHIKIHHDVGPPPNPTVTFLNSLMLYSCSVAAWVNLFPSALISIQSPFILLLLPVHAVTCWPLACSSEVPQCHYYPFIRQVAGEQQLSHSLETPSMDRLLKMRFPPPQQHDPTPPSQSGFRTTWQTRSLHTGHVTETPLCWTYGVFISSPPSDRLTFFIMFERCMQLGWSVQCSSMCSHGAWWWWMM